ncbi:SIR2 family protein [Paraburkholderia sp. USG1]|uniref:SIR2 family NAD-dependent protein deacylase n=1 Tax=Paraburkholderia sp. USG1 TaxID=2952268 RepID=UPI00285697F6|nr:SIR2 family protein [Paraburkholderia sp. USG1]MDR8399531.1 SIR2 family protein [Paraburkholderia sp. USG1]
MYDTQDDPNVIKHPKMNNEENNSIEDLPDYAALKKFASALWQLDNAFHGAAVMVGAGFSRGAATTGDADKKLSLWGDFSRLLAGELKESSAMDPLRLAEVYSAYFGKQNLYDLITKEINDLGWTPGPLYKSLLELPWSEVLTTNWDTLLERAAQDVHTQVYSVVRRQEELSSARSPRIVKLHGTVNITDELVFTQEDYRRYPEQYGTFVNFARQVFVENELCLLGFSGDDPNFLQWAGWVRDQLTTHVRRIYLAGPLRLTSAKRKYLESINIAPIDLAELVDDYDDRDIQHVKATELFLDALKRLKPKATWEWEPSKLRQTGLTADDASRAVRDAEYGASLLKQQLPTLEADRKSYPGWLVCPSSVRFQIGSQITDPFPNIHNIAKLEADDRARLLYEIAWRRSVTFEVILPWLVKELLKVCDPAEPNALTIRHQMEIALKLLKDTRWYEGEESMATEEKTTAILQANAKHWPEIASELSFHRAIAARDRLDYASVEKFADEIAATDPVWKMRKASLLADVGRFEEGEQLLAEAYSELLSRHRNDKNSIYVFSRLAWAHWLLRGTQMLKSSIPFERFPSIYNDAKCSPADVVDSIKERIAKELDEQNERNQIDAAFEAGMFRDNSGAVTINRDLHPLILLEGVSLSAGMPLRWNGIGFLSDPASTMTRLDDLEDTYKIPLSIRAANSDTSDSLKITFSRIRMACTTSNEAEQLRRQCIQAVRYWVSKVTKRGGSNSISRLRVLVEVLARVSIRATPTDAMEIFRLAMELGKTKELRHHWLFDVLEHLVEYTLGSVPAERHRDLLLDALLFPLHAEIDGPSFKEWPNPVITFPGKRTPNAALDRRIDEIIERIAPCSVASHPALERLLPLVEHNFLLEAELQKIAGSIWPGGAEAEALPTTGLSLYVLLKLPSPNPDVTGARIRLALFGITDDRLFEPALLAAIANAAIDKAVRERPTAKQAMAYFDKLVKWRPEPVTSDEMGLASRDRKQRGVLIGQVLSHSIVPALDSNALSEDRFERLYSFYSEVGAFSALIGLTYFYQCAANLKEKIEAKIRHGLHDREANVVAYASHALLTWREIAGLDSCTNLIRHMIYVLASGRSAGLAALLWTARQMHNNGWLDTQEIAVLTDSIPVLFEERDYAGIQYGSREAVSASSVRAACVRLARDILKRSEKPDDGLLEILGSARDDPLPEVRFAESNDDD